MRKIAIILILLALLSWLASWAGLNVPILKLFTALDQPQLTFPSHLLRGLALVAGIWLLLRPQQPANPLSVKRWRRFRSIRRGFLSAKLLGLLLLLAALDNLLVGKQALVVHYDGNWYFPFVQTPFPPAKFDQKDAGAEADYRLLQQRCHDDGKGNWVLMPLVPYAVKLDTPQQVRRLELREGKLFAENGEEFRGLAYTTFSDNPSQRRREYRVRKGVFHGLATGFDQTGGIIEKLEYRDGQLVDHQKLSPNADFAALDRAASPRFTAVQFPPAAPSWSDRHFLGTDSRGGDVLAQLYGGFQLLAVAAVFFVVLVYAVGITIGCLQGYFAGPFDMVAQRIIEILSVLPFLYVIIFLRSMVTPTLPAIVGVMAALSWMPITYYLRAGTLAEKARDYVPAAKLLGASTLRIVFRHILPNVLSTIVTKLPFTVELLISSLTALDFLGFGLPPEEPSWGSLLRDGVSNMQAPWILLGTFICIVTVLTLITFVGEAIREAFDPRKFTIYR